MKLQNMTVIFIIIMIPIIVVTSYYIGLQIKTITMQKDYTVKLQTAAKDSIQALEINTVEWNSSSSNLADSKRRDVLAAINTFTTSLANSMGIGGAGKGRIQTYIPAIAYTMYDGYYIYSASKVDTQETDGNGLTRFDDGNIIYKTGTEPSYQYILKPYSPYSARYVKGNIDITVNYTLDNYIKIYGTVGSDYVTKEGYLVVCDDGAVGINNVSNNLISEITYRGATITTEYLTEQIYIEGEGVKEYPYIYDQYDNKQYWDKEADPNNDETKEGNYFTVNANNQKVYLQTAVEEGDANFSISNTFRKISVPQEDSSGNWSVLKIFQILNPDGGYKFYYEDNRGAYVEFSTTGSEVGDVTVEKNKDFSAINYCVESYVFTKWVINKLDDITVGDLQSPTGGQYNNVDGDEDAKIFKISESNNPDPENDDAYAKSILAQHKKDVIINTLEKNLAQAQAQAQEMNPNYEYRLPQLTYDEWEQALSNISIIAYMQGMPIGLKYYNNYTIATSTLNKEYVDPDELYFAGTDDQYYHQRNCEQVTGSDYVGYRSIDYVAKSYEEGDTTKYYYPHVESKESEESEESSTTYAELECYYCLVNRSTYKATNSDDWTNSYYNALARERYKQIDEPGTYRPDVSITKTVSSSTAVEYGSEVTYTITITNNGIVDDTISLLDIWKENEIQLIDSTVSCTKENITVKTDFDATDENQIKYKGISAGYGTDTAIEIDAGETIIITYNAKILGNLGETIENTAAIYSYTNQEVVLDTATATTTVQKTINVDKTKVAQNYNIVLLLDHSNSMKVTDLQAVYSGVQTLLGDDYIGGKLFDNINKNNESDSAISMINFWGRARTKYSNLKTKKQIEEAIKKDYNKATVLDNLGGTNYSAALEKAVTEFNNMGNGKKNILVFFTDGAPTEPSKGDLGAVGYTIHREENEYYYWKHPLVGISKKENGGLGEKIWLKGNNGLNEYRGIQQIVEDMTDNNTDIYCINYGDSNSEYGLKNIISSYKEGNTEYYAYANDETGVEDAFENIGKSILNPDIGKINYSPATSNKIKLQQPDKITSIKVGSTTYEKDTEAYNAIVSNEGDVTYLNLSKISISETITITY